MSADTGFLFRKLQDYVTYEEYNEKQELMIRAGQWLKEIQHPAGYWGTRAPIETSLASLALLSVGVKIDESWSIPETGATGGLAKARDWLKKNRDTWSHNIWDTAVVLRTLVALGEPIESPMISGSLAWLKNQERDQWSHTKGTGLHHAAQALITITELREDRRNVQDLADWLMSHQDPEGSWNHSRYTTAQVVQGLAKVGYDSKTAAVAKALKWLEEEINRTVLEKGVFEDFGHSLIAYLEATGNPESEIAQKIAQEMLRSPERLKDDGSWYEDVRSTAIAVLALKALGHRKIFRIPARDLEHLLSTVENANNRILDLEARLRIAEESLRTKVGLLPNEIMELRLLDYLRKNEGQIFPSEAALHFGISEEFLMAILNSLEKKMKVKRVA